MDAQSYTAQERRAANQVWAAAGAYGFEPLFLARNTDGTIDFYMNCIVGLFCEYDKFTHFNASCQAFCVCVFSVNLQNPPKKVIDILNFHPYNGKSSVANYLKSF